MFTTVAQTDAALPTMINQAPEINDAGTVLFRGTDANGVEHAWLARQGPIDRAFNGAEFQSFSLSGSSQLNRHDDVAFFGTPLQGLPTALYVARDENLIEVHNDSLTPTATYLPAINDAGQIAFHGRLDNVDSILVGDTQGSPPRVVAATGAVTLSSAGPQINETGDVAYVSRALDTGLRTLHIARPDGGTTNVDTAATSTETIRPLRWISDNDLLYARNENNIQSWWLSQDGALSPIIPTLATGGRIIDLDVNASNQAAAYIEQASGGNAVLAGNVSSMSRLLGIWDNINGRRVAQVHFDTGGLNASGQVAMWVRTYDPATGRDYRTEIVVASPGGDPSPAPTTFAGTNFLEPPIGASSYVPGPGTTELGFSTASAPTSGANPLVGVGNIDGGPERYLAHRSVAATTTFDAVDLSGWQNPSVSMIVHFGGTSYEAGDFLTISASNGGNTVTLFRLQGGASSGDFGNFDRPHYLTWQLPEGWQQATLSISSFSNSSNGAEWYEVRQITFEGITPVPEPAAWSLIGAAMVALLAGCCLRRSVVQ